MQTTTYKLNVTPGGVPLTIHISQYDVGLRQYTFQPYTTVGEFSYVSGATVTLEATKPDGYAVIHECDYNQDGSITYTVQAQLAAKPGRVWSKVVIRDGSDVLGTGAIIWVVDYAGVKDNAIISDSDISALQQWMDDVEDYAEQADGSAQAAASAVSLAESAAASAQEAATQAAGYVDQAVILGGTPLVAATVSAMSDHDRVYVYTGSETGYTAGNWYYWNGSAWTSGGIYNSSAVQTDPTLSVSGMAADAAATGELKNDLARSKVSEKGKVVYINDAIPGSTPLFKPTSGTIYGRNIGLINAVTRTSNGITFAVDSTDPNTVTLSGTATSNAYSYGSINASNANITVPAGTYYMCLFIDGITGEYTNVRAYYNNVTEGTTGSIQGNRIYEITVNAETVIGVRVQVGSNTAISNTMTTHLYFSPIPPNGYYPYETPNGKLKSETVAINNSADDFIVYESNKAEKNINVFTGNIWRSDSIDDMPLINIKRGSVISFNPLYCNNGTVTDLRLYGVYGLNQSDGYDVIETTRLDSLSYVTTTRDYHHLQVATVPYATGTNMVFGLSVEGITEALQSVSNPKNKNACAIFKKVVCCGDSFTSGCIFDSSGVQHSTNEDYAVPHYLSVLTGSTWVNCGVSGANVLTWQTNDRGLPAAQSSGESQAYIISLGINDGLTDTSRYVPVGTSSDIGTSAETYYGGLSQIVVSLATISPNAHIFLNTNPNITYEEYDYTAYNKAVRDVASYYSGAYKTHLIDLDAIRGVYKIESITSDIWYSHLTATGYEQLAEIYQYVLSNYIAENISAFRDVAFLPFD